MDKKFYVVIENGNEEFLLIKKDTNRPERIWEWSAFIGNFKDFDDTYGEACKQLEYEMGIGKNKIITMNKIEKDVFLLKTNARTDEMILIQGEETTWVRKENVLNYPLAEKTKEIFKRILYNK